MLMLVDMLMLVGFIKRNFAACITLIWKIICLCYVNSNVYNDCKISCENFGFFVSNFLDILCF